MYCMGLRAIYSFDHGQLAQKRPKWARDGSCGGSGLSAGADKSLPSAASNYARFGDLPRTFGMRHAAAGRAAAAVHAL